VIEPQVLAQANERERGERRTERRENRQRPEFAGRGAVRQDTAAVQPDSGERARQDRPERREERREQRTERRDERQEQRRDGRTENRGDWRNNNRTEWSQNNPRDQRQENREDRREFRSERRDDRRDYREDRRDDRWDYRQDQRDDRRSTWASRGRQLDSRYRTGRYADWYHGRDNRSYVDLYRDNRRWFFVNDGWDQRWFGGIWWEDTWYGWDDPYLPYDLYGWSAYSWNPPRWAWGGRVCHRIVERDFVRGRPAFVSYRVCADGWGRRVASNPRFERWAY
jgi:hypothetical protein